MRNTQHEHAGLFYIKNSGKRSFGSFNVQLGLPGPVLDKYRLD